MLKRRRSDSKPGKVAAAAKTSSATTSKRTSAKAKAADRAASKPRAKPAVAVVASAPAPVSVRASRQPQLQVFTNPTPPTDPTTLELLNLGGPALDTGELMRAWGISREAISQKRKEKKLLGVMHGNTTLHPRWQFDAHLDLRPWVAQVLQAMPADVSPRFALRFFVYAHPALNGRRPAEVIDSPKGLQRVIELAATVGEQGAR